VLPEWVGDTQRRRGGADARRILRRAFKGIAVNEITKYAHIQGLVFRRSGGVIVQDACRMSAGRAACTANATGEPGWAHGGLHDGFVLFRIEHELASCELAVCLGCRCKRDRYRAEEDEETHPFA
jgi:hypothetical protein